MISCLQIWYYSHDLQGFQAARSDPAEEQQQRRDVVAGERRKRADFHKAVSYKKKGGGNPVFTFHLTSAAGIPRGDELEHAMFQEHS